MELTRSLVNRRFHLFQLCSSWREQALVEIPVHCRANVVAPAELNIDPRTTFEHSRSPDDDEIAFHIQVVQALVVSEVGREGRLP